MLRNSYPKLKISLESIRSNALELQSRCADRGVSLAAVIKGVNGDTEIIRTVTETGITQIASSRLPQILDCIEQGIKAEWLLLRSPQLWECGPVVANCDISVQTNLVTIREIEAECAKQGRTHDIILMVDMGDLREGYWDRSELLSDCKVIKTECPHLRVRGIATGYGDFSGLVPTRESLESFAALAGEVEKVLGYELKTVSGGATFVYPRIMDGTLPPRINHLRLGETLLLAHDLKNEYGLEGLDYLKQTMTLEAQIIEVREKPSALAEGQEQMIDAFGNKPSFKDRGMRRRALIALGRQDIGNADKIIPMDAGIEVIGSTSDHTVLDVTDCGRELRVGDIVSFRLKYEAMMFAFGSRSVSREYV